MNLSKFILITLVVWLNNPMHAQEDSLKMNFRNKQSYNYGDYKFLDSLIAGKKIIMLGESSHGIADFTEIKLDIIKYLHEKHNYKVIAFESGVATCNMSNLIKDSLSSFDLLIRSLLGVWRSTEALNLLDYIKSRDIQISGIDPNNSALPLNKYQYNLIIDNKSIANKLAKLDSLYLYNYKIPKSKIYRSKKQLDTSNIYKAKEYLKIEYQKVLSYVFENDKIVIAHSINSRLNNLKITNLNKNSPNFYITNQRRDSIMAKNLEFISDSIYPGEKIVVWAHNAHIAKVTFNKGYNGGASINNYLRNDLKSKSFVLGIYASSGYYSRGLSSPYKIKPRRNSLESKLKCDSTKAVFYASNDIIKKNLRHGMPDFFKSPIFKLYDGIIIISEVKAKHLLRNNPRL